MGLDRWDPQDSKISVVVPGLDVDRNCAAARVLALVDVAGSRGTIRSSSH
jgi:hypothetical protein